MAKAAAIVDPSFPDQIYTMPTMAIGSHRMAFIPQGDEDEARSEQVEQTLKRLRKADRLAYPGLYDPEE